MKRNILLFYILRALFLPFFWLPVLYIYLTKEKGLSPAEAAFLLSLQELLLIFLEIPTGVVADKISRKFSVGLGYILTALPFVFLPFVDAFFIYIIIFGIKAVGKALISGADTSLLYDTLVDLDRTSEYKKIINKSKSMMMAVAAICIFLGGLIAQYNISLTLILPFPLMLIGAIAAFLMEEPETSKKAKQIQDSNYLKHTWSAFKFITKSKYLLILALGFAIVESTAINMKWYYTPIFEKLNLNLASIGGLTAFFYIAKSVLSGLSVKLLKDHQNKKNMILFSILTTVLFILPAIVFNSVIVILVLVGIILFTEALLSIYEEEIHNNLESHNRATSSSIVNLFSSLIATLTLNAFGVFNQYSGIKASLLFLAGTFFILVVLSFVKSKPNAHKSKV